MIDLPSDDFFRMYSSPYNTIRHRFCLEVKHTSTNFLPNRFARRVVKSWKKLPANIVEPITIGLFRSNLHKFDLTTIADLTVGNNFRNGVNMSFFDSFVSFFRSFMLFLFFRIFRVVFRLFTPMLAPRVEIPWRLRGH